MRSGIRRAIRDDARGSSRSRIVRSFAAAISAIFVAGCEEPTPAVQTEEQQAGYVVGYEVGEQVKERYGDLVDPAAAGLGMRDALAGVAGRFESAERGDIRSNLEQLARDQSMSDEDKANLEAGRAFLDTNAKRDGVVTTASGLQYEVITDGDGATPGPMDNVTTHYHGTLIDGTVFDSSVRRGEPLQFPVNGVIKGWVEALQLMQVGDKWRLFIPQELAYAERGTGNLIKPYSALVFEVELLAVN